LGACPLVAAHGGRVWVLSGFHYDATPGAMCDLKRDVWVYDPAARAWTAGPPLPCAEAWGAAFSLGDTLVTAGGAHWSRTARTFVFENRCFALDGCA